MRAKFTKTLSILTVICASLFFVTSFTSEAVAQNIALHGVVVDEVGAVIPNAEVTLTSSDGKQRKAKSSYNGEFSFGNVPAGTYTVTAAFKGFQTQVENDVKVPVPGGLLTVTMTVAAVNVIEEVAANMATVSTEPDQNMNATVLGEDFIKNLPDNEDDLRDFLTALAGPTASGGNGQGADIMVDGFNGGRLPPKEAILQIRINQNPFSAEYANPGFGRIEIITKPGNDQWRGGGSWGYRNATLDARNAFALIKPDLMSNRFSFNFGGPVIKKRMSMTIFADRNNTDGSNTTVATTLDGQVVSNVPTQTINNFIGLQTDFLLNNKNTFNVRYYYRNSESINQEFAARFGGGFAFGGGFGGGGFGGGGGGFGGGGTSNLLPERGSNRENSNHTLRLAETWIVNSSMIHEARLQFERERTEQVAKTKGIAINVFDSFSGGGSPCCPNSSRTDTLEYQDYLTYTTKGSKHTIKGGIQLNYDMISDVSGNNFNGTYSFTDREQYRNALLNIGTPLAIASQLSINRGDQNLDYSMFRGAWFVGDDWRIRQSLTLSFGLRHEFQNHVGDQVNFAPRIGIAWSPFKNRKTTIRAGGGIFFDRFRNNYYENALRYNGTRQISYQLRNAIFSNDPFAANPNLVPQNQVLRPLDPNLKMPYDINGSVSVEQQLPKGLIASVTYIYSKGLHQFRSRNINAAYPVVDPADPSKIAYVRPDPRLGNIYEVESSAASQTNRLSFGLNRRVGKFSMFGNYTLSWIRSNGEGLPADSYNLTSEWGRSAADRRHNFFTGSFINLPKGFRINTFINASSGSPFNITTGLDPNGDGSYTERPLDANGNPIRRNSDLSASLYSTAQFNRLICPPGSTCGPGGAPMITLRQFLTQKYPDGVTAQGPGNFTVNAYLSKTFGFGKSRNALAQGGDPGGGGRGQGGGGGRGPGGGGPGGGRGGGGPMMVGGGGGPMMVGMGGPGAEGSRFTVTLTMGVTNLFNRVNFSNYGGTLGSSYFGLSSQSSPARQLDFNVRFNF